MKAVTYAFRQYDHPSRKVHKNKTKQNKRTSLEQWPKCLGVFVIMLFRIIFAF